MLKRWNFPERLPLKIAPCHIVRGKDVDRDQIIFDTFLVESEACDAYIDAIVSAEQLWLAHSIFEGGSVAKLPQTV